MSNNVKVLKKKLTDRISNMYDSLIEIRKTLLTQNKEGKMNGIIEKIEKYQNELRTIQEKLKAVEDKTQIEEINKEYEKTITNDIEIERI